ncbi:non-homologous end-joining DNA ligase [Paraburkholderia franconis]|nr:non-homologous end-joining DNA ligase [Paraburkholderia franconis]
MPLLIEPQLATLAAHPPSRGDWQYEIKLDGYRMLARIDCDGVRLITRNGHDWTTRLPKLRDALARLPVDDVWLDGEVVVLDKEGRTDFNALQNAFDLRSTANVTLYLFDLLWLDGIDRRNERLMTRRRLLRELLEVIDEPLIRFSENFDADPTQLMEAARSMKLEGIIGKRVDAPYRSGRSTTWIKLKCGRRQAFVVGGISRGSAGVDSLMLGVFEQGGRLRYVGSVPPYFRSRQAAAFLARATPQHEAPFRNPPRPERDREYLWLSPEIVVEVSFREWTPRGELRHTKFLAVRHDKSAHDVSMEAVTDPNQ